MMTEQAAFIEPQRSWKRPGSKIFWAIIAVLLFVACPLVIVFAVLDSTSPQWVRCDLNRAENVQGNRLNASPWIVAIETTDCGRITYTEGVTEENAAEIAASFVESAEYEFKLGLTSRLAADGWIPFLRPMAHAYREIE